MKQRLFSCHLGQKQYTQIIGKKMKATRFIIFLAALFQSFSGAFAQPDRAHQADELLLEEAQAIVERRKLTPLGDINAADLLVTLLRRWHNLPSEVTDSDTAAFLDNRDPIPAGQAPLRSKAYELIADLASIIESDQLALAAFRRAEWITATHSPEDTERLARLRAKIARLQDKSWAE